MNEETPRREIFRYSDGTRERGIDPIKALRELLSQQDFALGTDPQLAETGDQEAYGRTVGAVRRVFAVAEWSEDDTGKESGTTETECMQLLKSFADYLDEIKKNISPPQTSQPATEPNVSVSQPTAPNASDTSSTSDSISTSPDPRPAEPVDSSGPSVQQPVAA